jgi:hypothetical protein
LNTTIHEGGDFLLKALRITIDIFSGRENPIIELKGNEAQEAIERLQPVHKIEEKKKGLPPEPTLGYRGLIIEQIGKPITGLPKVFRYAHGDLFGPGLVSRAKDKTFEDFVCGSNRVKELGKPFPGLIKEEIERFRGLRERWRVGEIVWPPRYNPCRCAPVYEPRWWNVSSIRPYNNCYNYATNYRTDTFAQPGRAAGAMYTSYSCSAVKSGAVKDKLIDSPTASNECPTQGHLVALVIWPGRDFHWYRKGQNGYWSHKPGSTSVTNLDNNGVTISDPRTANRGPYTDFCEFMVVKHGHIKIS